MVRTEPCRQLFPPRAQRHRENSRLVSQWRIAYLLGLNVSTVHRVLTRYGVAKLCWLDRATGQVVRRYEHPRPGDLVHLDVKKLGKIPDGGGWRIHGRSRANETPWPTDLSVATAIL